MNATLMPDIYSRPNMYTERRIERHQLPYYLKVYNRHTGRAMGYLGNVSDVGLMLILAGLAGVRIYRRAAERVA